VNKTATLHPPDLGTPIPQPDRNDNSDMRAETPNLKTQIGLSKSLLNTKKKFTELFVWAFRPRHPQKTPARSVFSKLFFLFTEDFQPRAWSTGFEFFSLGPVVSGSGFCLRQVLKVLLCGRSLGLCTWEVSVFLKHVDTLSCPRQSLTT
jgi:hypothetical protein